MSDPVSYPQMKIKRGDGSFRILTSAESRKLVFEAGLIPTIFGKDIISRTNGILSAFGENNLLRQINPIRIQYEKNYGPHDHFIDIHDVVHLGESTVQLTKDFKPIHDYFNSIPTGLVTDESKIPSINTENLNAWSTVNPNLNFTQNGNVIGISRLEYKILSIEFYLQ